MGSIARSAARASTRCASLLPVRRSISATSALNCVLISSDSAVVAKGLINRNAIVWEPQQPRQPSLTVIKRLPPDVLAVHFQQIEGTQEVRARRKDSCSPAPSLE